MNKLLFMAFFLLAASGLRAQLEYTLQVSVQNSNSEAVPHFTLELFNTDSVLLRIYAGDEKGQASLPLPPATYLLRISSIHYQSWMSQLKISRNEELQIRLTPEASELAGVTVAARKPFVEMKPGKTIVNVEASISSVGATAYEALEKMPGITISRDGQIALKGKQGVNVFIDGKPLYLDAAQLVTLLEGMNASQISRVEIMDNPPARFDAAGNAGVINIITKKTRQKGFHGSIASSFGQGNYPKSNNQLQLNFRTGKWNLFLNHNFNSSRHYTRIYAFRRYFHASTGELLSQLEQESFFRSTGRSHNLKTGLDYALSERTTLSGSFSLVSILRSSKGDNPARWMNASGTSDSLIRTYSTGNTDWQHRGGTLGFRHVFNARTEISADMDLLNYQIMNQQYFENKLVLPGNYTEAFRAHIPNRIDIVSGKLDYTTQFRNMKMETGWKSSRIRTNNLAQYEWYNGSGWEDDLGRSNHFIYREHIHAIYASAETKKNKWSVQGGLRYEMTDYDAHQLGNAIVKDSSFSRSYKSLFPSFATSFEADSLHQFSFSVSRRIDRPAFQKLNPFVFIINKYTFQQGNPFYRPQYTWNFELTHIFHNRIITGISYSTTSDYFSQVFPIDSNGIVIYTEGNLKRLQQWGASLALNLNPARWWSLNSQVVLNHKKMEGVIDRPYSENITQVHVSLNNQFRFGRGWSGEISGFYTSRSQHDIQEVVDPSGQLSIGLGKQVLKNKGSIRLAARDIFHTQWMKGNTLFTDADEYFKLTRDTRVLTLSFSYRFGKEFKTGRRSQGASREEMERVGN